ncbi:MAG: hypothetical protein NC127_04135 [Muribaculum sp.]|nr:hypothetical protein [Muribaculum sp.]
MGILYTFLSSFLLGAGCGLALTLVCAFLARQFFGINWIKNTFLSVFLLIFATFQIVLLFGAYTTKDYVDQAYSLVTNTKEYVDFESLTALIPNIEDYIPEEYLPEEASDAVDAVSSTLIDASEAVSSSSDKVVNASLGLINAVNATLNAYILRRWLWLGAELAVFFILAGFMRRRTPKYTSELDMFGGTDGTSSTATMNF